MRPRARENASGFSSAATRLRSVRLPRAQARFRLAELDCGFFQFLKQRGIERHVKSRQGLIELLGFACADNRTGNGRIREHPGNGECGERNSYTRCDLRYLIHDVENRFLPVAAAIELSDAPRVGKAGTFGGLLGAILI